MSNPSAAPTGAISFDSTPLQGVSFGLRLGAWRGFARLQVDPEAVFEAAIDVATITLISCSSVSGGWKSSQRRPPPLRTRLLPEPGVIAGHVAGVDAELAGLGGDCGSYPGLLPSQRAPRGKGFTKGKSGSDRAAAMIVMGLRSIGASHGRDQARQIPEMRDFSQTAEPSGRRPEVAPAVALRFVSRSMPPAACISRSAPRV